MNRSILILSVLILGCSRAHDTQSRPDPGLLREIAEIRAIDVHSHSRPAGEGLEDAAGLEPYLASLVSKDPAMVRVDTHHHDYLLAWRALYGYAADDMERAHVLQALEAKRRLIRGKGDGYPAWVLDQAGIDKQLVFPAPLTRMGAGQSSPRFRCVAFATPLVYPFAGDRPEFTDLLASVGMSRLPPTLAEYAKTLVMPTLERWKHEGAVGVKFGLAYRRSLSFAEVPEDEAASIYRKYARAGTGPPAAEYKAVQDYLFRLVVREAGQRGLVVFVHTGVGSADYFNISGSNPALLEPIFNDPAFRGTRFVIVHGGWPYDREAGVMLQKPNVFADFSVQPLLRSTRAVSMTLRAWLEWAPEKVMFGTDAYSQPDTPLANWEEKTWVATRAAREALALALTEMMEDGQLSHEQALLLARMVLRENAIQLFGLQ